MLGLSIPELFDLRDRSELFDEIAGVWPVSANLTETDEPERVETALVGATYFQMLGVAPQLGRLFGASDEQPGITEIAVISDALWRRRFGADPHVLGRRIRIDNDLYLDHRRGAGFVSSSRPRHRNRCRRVGSRRLAAAPFPATPNRRAVRVAGRARAAQAGHHRRGRAGKARHVVGRTARSTDPAEYPAAAGWTLRMIPLHADLVGPVAPALITLARRGRSRSC